MFTWLKSLAKATLYAPLFNLLIFFTWLVPDHNVGWAIILLTVLVRLILYPLNASMIRSQRALTALQPELDRIKSEYHDDQQAQAKATMELYQARKINPFGSCLLTLVQLPVLWVLYRVFQVGLDTSHFALLYSFTPRPDHVANIFLGINLTHPSLIFGVLAGLAQFVQSRQLLGAQPNKAKSKDAATASQAAVSQQLLYLFPILTIVLSARFPAALTLYWLITTLAMVAQQWLMSRQPLAAGSAAVTVTVRQPNKSDV